MKSYLVLNTLSLICLPSLDMASRFIKIKGFTLRIHENVVPTRVVRQMVDRKEPLPAHGAACDVLKSQPCPVHQCCKSVS